MLLFLTEREVYMFLGRVNNYTSVANQPIPFATVLNTNDKIANNLGVISLRKGGIWNVDASITVTGVVGDIVATLYADGVATNAAQTASLGATTDFATIPLSEAVRTVLASYPDVANISIGLGTAGLTVNGSLRVEYLQ